MNSLKVVFVNTDLVLCKWHTNKDVRAYIRRVYDQVPDPNQVSDPDPNQAKTEAFVDSEQTEACFQAFKECIDAQTDTEFFEKARALDEAYPKIGLYLDTH